MKTITFYSYKGGVGRSLALANIATRLSEFGKKVCLIDFDLEAPGLPSKFARYIPMNAVKNGIVDYVHSYVSSGTIPENISKYSITFPIFQKGSPITLIPAGNTETVDYWKKLSYINWYNLLYENDNGLAFFLDFKEKIKKEIKPDFLLIDSRTGISEMSGITLSLFADEVVVVAANNRENLSGAKKIIKSISSPDNSLFGKTPKITFVLSRIPFTETAEDKIREQNLINRIKREVAVGDVNIIHSDRELEENERIKIAYEKDESLAQSSRDYLQLFEQLTKEDLTHQEVQKFNDLRESEKLFNKAVSVKSLPEKLNYALQAGKLNPGNIDLQIYLARVHLSLKMFIEAEQILLKLEQEYPNYISILQELTRTYSLIQNTDLAIEYCKKILELDKNNYSGLYMLATNRLAQGKHEDAISIFSTLINYYPESSEAFNGRGNVYRLLDKYDLAKADVYKALELNPDFGIGYATLAEINAALGDKNEFYLNLEKALKLDGDGSVKTAIKEEKIYEKFTAEERFRQLQTRYNTEEEDIEI